MTRMIKAGIIGGTGYTGLSLLEVLTRHKNVELQFATTRRRKLVGKPIHRDHPNLLGLTDLKYSLEARLIKYFDFIIISFKFKPSLISEPQNSYKILPTSVFNLVNIR